MSVIAGCVMTLKACVSALPHYIDAEDDYPCLIFHHHFEPTATLAEKTFHVAGLVALFFNHIML